MNGPEHYAEAERLLARADAETTVPHGDALRAKAQVHATLAHTAATAFPYGSPSSSSAAWREAIHGSEPETPDPFRGVPS